MTIREATLLSEIPARIDTNKTLGMIHSGKVGAFHLQVIKNLTAFNDKKISTWFDISEKTFREFKVPNHNIKARIQEHTITILSLIKHGIEVFGTAENFTKWLEKENFFFDKKPPIEWMNTYSGVKFIDDKLTAMEYGDTI